MGNRKISLFGAPNVKLPKWYRNQSSWGIELRYTTARLFNYEPLESLKEFDMGTFSIWISSPERAILETLYFIPEKQSFEEGYYLMEGLGTLRPTLVQSLLEACCSIKTKRIFLFLSRCCNHAWRNKLDFGKIDLGAGKRMIEKNGFLDQEYLITVPQFFKEHENVEERP